MKQKKPRRKNWMLRAASVLLCMVLVSLYMVCGLFARYTTSASGADSARVAKFEIVETGVTTLNLNDPIWPGKTVEKDLQIQNKSEVAVEYEVTVANMTNNLPLQFLVDGKDATETSFTAILPPNENVMNIFKLQIKWPDTLNSPDYSGQVDRITVTVSATQID